jgi:hypothetical protein
MEEETEMTTKISRKIKIIALGGLLVIQMFALSGISSLQAFAAAPAQRPDDPQVEAPVDPEYIEAIQRTAGMTNDPAALELAAGYGLNVVNVMWEDTGRYKNSSVGPNISDVTIQVMHRDPRSGEYQLSLMPVIRNPNFSDLTADIPLDQFFLVVGNEKGEGLHKVNLREYLGNFRQYLHDAGSWSGEETSLLAERDSYVLVSAQAAFLPVPEEGQAEFNPVIFNYQSYQGDPAVLTLVATREGTSATIIDNVRDGFPAGYSWGQRLFFNQNGERASFTGERFSDFVNGENVERDDSGNAPPASAEALQAGGESGLNLVLVIQVPLKQKNPLRPAPFAAEAMLMAAPTTTAKSDVEAAVIGHGAVEGPFTEIDGLAIERDDRFPIRVTVQFYKATSNGVVSETDMQEIADQIQRVYQEADYVGSLVVDGETGRPTEYEGPKEEPPGWWEAFWQRFESNTGLTRQEALDLWQQLKMNAGRWFNIQE